jgi:hypothetical protein
MSAIFVHNQLCAGAEVENSVPLMLVLGVDVLFNSFDTAAQSVDTAPTT